MIYILYGPRVQLLQIMFNVISIAVWQSTRQKHVVNLIRLIMSSFKDVANTRMYCFF